MLWVDIVMGIFSETRIELRGIVPKIVGFVIVLIVFYLNFFML